MSTKVILAVVLVGIVLLVILSKLAKAATPQPQGAGGAGYGGILPGGGGTATQVDTSRKTPNTSDISGALSKFTGYGADGQALASSPNNFNPATQVGTPQAGPVTQLPPAAPSIAPGSPEYFATLPATDLRAGLLRGYGRNYQRNGGYIAGPAKNIFGLVNLTPGAGGSWDYNGEPIGNAPSLQEWAAFDAARKSVLGG